MQRFKTLLLREWFQHRLGWLVTLAVPLVIALLVLAAGEVTINVEDSELSLKIARLPVVAVAAVAIVGTGALSFVIAWFVSLMQASGLARRDHQDRSIEFWLSLPVGHASALAAPMLAHLILFPLAALAVGLLAGHVLSLLVVGRVAGVAEWFGLPWGLLTVAWLGTLLRAAIGLVLATLWLSPLIGLVMAGSAWLGRWGVAAVIGGVVVLGNVLNNLYGNPVVWSVGRQLLRQAGMAFVSGATPGGLRFTPATDPLEVLRAYPGWVAADAWQALHALAHPLLPPALAVAAGCFALLVLRRRRGG